MPHGSFPSKFWSRCPCQGRGFDAGRDSYGGSILPSPRLQGCLMPLSDTGRDGHLYCRRCAILDKLCLQVEELWEEVGSLHSIREDEREINKELLLDATA